MTLLVSSDASRPVVGGGVANTAFLQGTDAGGPNAQAAVVTAIFWIETVTDPATGSQFLQLQYTQTVLLNFNGLSWPHITVATLRKLRNSAEPTIAEGDAGKAVRWLERALRRTGDKSVEVDGVFNATVTTAVKNFQASAGLTQDGVVGPKTWNALPEGGPMPTLHLGAKGDVVKSLQSLLTNGAPGQWNVTPGAIDSDFGASNSGLCQGVPDLGGGQSRWRRRQFDLVGLAFMRQGRRLESAVGLNFVQS